MISVDQHIRSISYLDIFQKFGRIDFSFYTAQNASFVATKSLLYCISAFQNTLHQAAFFPMFQ